MRTKRWMALAAVTLTFGLVAAACGDDSSDDGATDDTTETTAAPAEGKLTGMKGTTPLVDLGDEFKNRLKEIDPNLSDFNYAAESYDAAIVIALAATEANTDGIEFASKINGITRGGEKCTTFADC